MSKRIPLSLILLLASLMGYSQIRPAARDIKNEVSKVDATHLKDQIKLTTVNTRTLLQKRANKKKSKEIKASWSKANEEDEYVDFIDIPKIAFPGYVKVTLTHPNGDLKPHMIISPELKTHVILSGSSAHDPNYRVSTAYFSVPPGMTYDVRVRPFFNAKNYPVPYTLKWEYTGHEDIYEPNDNMKQAKYIDLNTTISAYAISGHIKYYVGAWDANTFDWYSVVLNETKKIEVYLNQIPRDMDLDVRLFDSAGKTVGITQGIIKGMQSIRTTKDLPKGVYYIEVHAKLKNGSSRVIQGNSQPIADHFTRPYKFRVSMF